MGLVEKREVSTEELPSVATERAAAVDGRLNVMVRPMHDVARERARSELSGPFAGVPFLLKDLHQHYPGQPTGNGSRSLAGHPRPVAAQGVTSRSVRDTATALDA